MGEKKKPTWISTFFCIKTNFSLCFAATLYSALVFIQTGKTVFCEEGEFPGAAQRTGFQFAEEAAQGAPACLATPCVSKDVHGEHACPVTAPPFTCIRKALVKTAVGAGRASGLCCLVPRAM